VTPAERRQLERFRLRVPLRFRQLGLASDHTEHFTETANISRGGFFFVTSAPLQVGMPIEATLNMPSEVTGGKADETHCRARLVHAKPDAYSDGRMGFGAEIEMYIEPKKPDSAGARPLPSPEKPKP
jgi:PilZ domain